MKNQDTMKTSHHVKEPIEIFFNQIETGQEFEIAVNSPFSNCEIADMGITQILETQEYAHVYAMWTRILANERTLVRFKAHFREAYLDRKELKQTVGEA